MKRRPAVARWATMVAVVAGATWASCAVSAPSWELPAVDVALRIDADRSIEVNEVIHVNFGPNERAGIERVIPTRILHPLAGPIDVSVEVVAVSTGKGATVPFEVHRGVGAVTVAIGDANDLRVGETIFLLQFRVHGALVHRAGRDYLTWPARSGEWDADIFGVEVVAHLPEPVPTEQIRAVSRAGYFAESGRQADVHAIEEQRVVFRLIRGLSEFERLTVDLSWPATLAGGDDGVRRVGDGGRDPLVWVALALGALGLSIAVLGRKRTAG